MPTVVTVSDPKIRAGYEKNLPSRQERRDNITSQLALCWGCGKTVPRIELRMCAKCKVARYCDQECQRTHWRAGHKSACSPAHNLHPNDVTLKLAERAIADPYIAQLLKCYSILSLDLLHDRSNATRFAVNVVCTTGPADIMADIARLASTGDANPDPNAPIRLKISTIRRVPLEETPRAVQKAAAESRSKGMGIRDPVTNALLPVITSYFSYSGARGEGQIMGEVFAVLMVDSMSLEYMASKPKVTLQSPMFGERELDMDMPTIQHTMDRHIEMDRDNKLRLRMYPNGAPLSSNNNATREETRGMSTSSDTGDISTGRTLVLSSPWASEAIGQPSRRAL